MSSGGRAEKASSRAALGASEGGLVGNLLFCGRRAKFMMELMSLRETGGSGWCKNKPLVYFCTNFVRRLEKTFQAFALFVELLQRLGETN